jgi:hypothetical protein
MQSAVCGLVDPFCEHAYGAKYPDDSSAKTLPFTVRQLQTLSSDAQGELGVVVSPQVNFDPFAPCTVVGTTMTVGAVPAPTVALLAGVAKFRIVSVGVRVTNIAPALTASGMIHFRSFAQENAVGLGSIDGTTYSASQVHSRSLQECKGFCVILERNSQMPQIFYDPLVTAPSNVFADQIFPGTCPLTICGQGLPAATPCIQVELVMHVEYIFSESAALALATTPAPSFNPLITTTANRITASSGHIFSDNVKSVGMYVAKSALNLLATAVSARLGPGAGALVAAGGSFITG